MQKFKRKKNKQKDLGRSVVEMLGVLAVIGVLTIAGISGYQMSMNKYTANKMANELNLIQSSLFTQLIQGSEQVRLGTPYDTLNPGEGVLSTDSYPFRYGCGNGLAENGNCSEVDSYFIEVQNVPKKICHPLAAILNFIPRRVSLKINEIDYGQKDNCNGGENKIYILFDTDESISHENNSSEGTPHLPEITENPGPESTIPPLITTSSTERCPESRPLIGGNGLCYGCDVAGVISYDSDTDCSKCPGLKKDMYGYSCIPSDCTNKPLRGSDGNCYSCDEPNGIYVDNCSICSNRFQPEGDSRCYPDTIKDCSEGTFKDSQGYCHSCDASQIDIRSTPEACSVCGNKRVYSDGKCCKACPEGYKIADYGNIHCGCVKK